MGGMCVDGPALSPDDLCEDARGNVATAADWLGVGAGQHAVPVVAPESATGAAPLTVADLRRMIEGLSDDLPVVVRDEAGDWPILRACPDLVQVRGVRTQALVIE